MATNKQLKFFKGANAPAAPVAGMIWFCTTDRTIRVYTGTEWEKYSGLVNAEWVAEDKKLNITSANGTVTTLDLSDCASASDISSKLTTINNTLTSHDSRITAAQNAADAAASAAAVADGKAVQEKADREAAISEVKGLISAEQTRAEGKEAENKAAAEAADKKAADAQTYAEGVNTALGQEVTRAIAKEDELAGKISALETAVGAGGSVETQINTKIEALDADVTSAEGTQVRVQVVETDGKITAVNVTESATFATAQALADEIADRAVDEQAIIDRVALLDTAETGRVSVLETKVAALASATHFLGVKDSLDDVASPVAGDIVIVGDKEYVYDDVKGWVELGDVSEEQNRLTQLESWKTEASQDIADLGAEIDAVAKDLADNYATDAELQALANGAVKTNTEKIAEIEGEVDLNTGAVADHETRIEALEGTANDLGTTYVKVSDYNTDKQAFEQKHTDLQGEIDTAEGRLDVVEGDITTIKGEQSTQNAAISAADAKGAQGISDAAAALAEAQAKVKSVTGDADVNASTTDHAVSLSLNKATSVAEGDTKAVTSGAVYDALCWIEFE